MIKQFFQDHKGSLSISRVLPPLIVLWILGLTSYVTLKTGALADIPRGWAEIFLVAIGPYVASKASEALTKEAPSAE